ncbi:MULTISPECIES: hypothetical protein [Streptomyces]|uniref:hypothetical protein n=1 Tax=Streptomyces TaxID=1883 RepID=UPI0004CBFC83|nr:MULTISPECIES: hypothetical protein [Streptomyces]MDP9954183.1 hypothetical protein [Streptomyces sp. DSM 41269]
MSTPVPEERASEVFTESAAEAVQTSVMAARLVMAIADAARRHRQRKQLGEEAELPAAEEAVEQLGEDVERLLPPDIAVGLMKEADRPQLAQQLLALREAGVDLEQVLPRIGEVAVNVRDQVTAKGVSADTERWERVVREALPAGPVREGVLTSPTRPEIAATMTRLDDKGVDVAGILTTMYDTVQGVDQAVATSVGAPAARMSKDAQLLYGPLSIGLDLPPDFDPSDRARAFAQLAISPKENETYARWLREAIPGYPQEAERLLASNRWPLVAARMAQTENDSQPVAERLASLAKDTSWTEGTQVTAQLARATVDALTGPGITSAAGGRAPARVSTAAARATSPSTGPTRRAKAAAPGEAAVAPHRQAGQAPARGRTK